MSKSQQQVTLSTSRQSQASEPIDQAKRAFYIELTLEIVYSVIRIIIGIVLVALSCRIEVGSIHNSNGFHRMQEVIQIWQTQIILEFTTTQTINCPQYFQSYTTDQWPGTLEGCLCSTPQGLYHYDLIFRGKCSEIEFDHGCRTIPSHSSIPYTFWRANVHLCVRRLENYNFYTSASDIVSSQGYSAKHCASGTPYQIDLISILNCPVTSIATGSLLGEQIEGMDLSFSREDNYPAVSLRISEHQFCEDYSKTNVSPGRKSNYILLTTTAEECQQLDQRIQLLDQLNEVQFFENNHRIEQIILSLPDYPLPDRNVNYRLGYNRYPPWTYQCRQSQAFSLHTTTIFLTLSELTSQFQAFRIILLVLLSLELAYLLYYWIFHYLYLQEKYQQGYLYLKDYQIKKINNRSNIAKNWENQVIKFFIVQILGAAILLVNVAVYSKASEQQEWCQNAYNCTSPLIITYLTDYEQCLGGIVVVALACVFLIVAVIVLDLLFLLWRRWKGDLEPEEDSQKMVQEKDELETDEPKHLNVGSIEVTEELLVAQEGQHDNGIKLEKMLFEIEDQQGSDSSRYSSNSSERST